MMLKLFKCVAKQRKLSTRKRKEGIATKQKRKKSKISYVYLMAEMT